MPRVNRTPWVDRHAGPTPVKAPARKGINWIAGRLARIQHPDIECETFYSLAQHSVVMARILEDDARLALYGLMHHAHAAWLGGVSREGHAEIERLSFGEEPLAFLISQCDRVALPDVGLPEVVPTDVLRVLEVATRVANATARRDLVPGSEIGADEETFNKPINPLTWDCAEELFINEAERLCMYAGLPMMGVAA